MKNLRDEVIVELKRRGFRYVENDLRVGNTWLPKGPAGAARYFNGAMVVDVTGYVARSFPFGQCNQKRDCGFQDFLAQLRKATAA